MHLNRALQISFASLVFLLGIGALAATGALADPLTCVQVQEKLTSHNGAILAKLAAEVEGRRHKLGPLKTLVINGVSAIEVGGNCDVTVTLEVKLKRKIRRDASGQLKVGAHVAVSMPNDHVLDINFDNLHITDVNLSHTMEVGEQAYKAVANLLMPRTQTLNVEI
jgi:hypothetical protein